MCRKQATSSPTRTSGRGDAEAALKASDRAGGDDGPVGGGVEADPPGRAAVELPAVEVRQRADLGGAECVGPVPPALIHVLPSVPAMRTYPGRPSSPMRFSARAAIATSVC